MRLWVALLLLTLLPFTSFADDTLADRAQEERAVRLGEEIRCVVCQSESINDSQADMARDMRLLVRDKIRDGWSDQQILTFARDRYGDFILLRPPVQVNTYLLWAFPLLILVAAGGTIWSFFKKNKRALTRAKT
jgi:cytochrome c-type biogenesis protein CcmH